MTTKPKRTKTSARTVGESGTNANATRPKTGDTGTYAVLIKNPKPLCRSPRKDEIGKWITIGSRAKLASAHCAAASC